MQGSSVLLFFINFREKLLKYNQLLKERYGKSSNIDQCRLDRKELERKRSMATLLMEIRKTRGLTYMEKQLQNLIDKISCKDFVTILDFNIAKIQDNLKLVTEEVLEEEKKQKEAPQNKIIQEVKKMDEFSSSCSDSSFSPTSRKISHYNKR